MQYLEVACLSKKRTGSDWKSQSRQRIKRAPDSVVVIPSMMQVCEAWKEKDKKRIGIRMQFERKENVWC